jgi:hypothetical protein
VLLTTSFLLPLLGILFILMPSFLTFTFAFFSIFDRIRYSAVSVFTVIKLVPVTVYYFTTLSFTARSRRAASMLKQRLVTFIGQ